jgi:hypothetical protein
MFAAGYLLKLAEPGPLRYAAVRCAKTVDICSANRREERCFAAEYSASVLASLVQIDIATD